MFEQDGVTLDITFDLGIMDDVNICVMTYNEEDGSWESIVKVVNNGVGTVTCTFAHFCVVAFSMITATSTAQTTSGGSIAIWVVLFLLAAAAVAAILILKNKKKVAA